MNGSVNSRDHRSIQNSKYKGHLLNGPSSDSKPVSSERRSSVPSGTSSHQKLEYGLAKDILEELKGRIGDKVAALPDSSPYKSGTIDLDTMVRVLFTSTDGSEQSLADKIGLDSDILQTGSLKEVLLEFGSKMYEFQVGLNETLESGKSLTPLQNGELASLTNTQRESLNDAYWLLKSVRVVGKADSGASSANSSFQKDIQQFKEAHEEIALTNRTTIGDDGKVSYNQAKDSKSSGAAFTNYFAGALAKDLEFRQESAQKAMATMQDNRGVVAREFVNLMITHATGSIGSANDVKPETLEAKSDTKVVAEAFVDGLFSKALDPSRASNLSTQDSLPSIDLADTDSTGTVQTQFIDLEENQVKQTVQTTEGDGESVSRSSANGGSDSLEFKPSDKKTVENKDDNPVVESSSNSMGGFNASQNSAVRTDNIPVNPLPLKNELVKDTEGDLKPQFIEKEQDLFETNLDENSVGQNGMTLEDTPDELDSSKTIPIPPSAKKKSTLSEQNGSDIESCFEQLDQKKSTQNKTNKKQVSSRGSQVHRLNIKKMYSQSAPSSLRKDSGPKPLQRTDSVRSDSSSVNKVTIDPLNYTPRISNEFRSMGGDSPEQLKTKQDALKDRVNYHQVEFSVSTTPRLPEGALSTGGNYDKKAGQERLDRTKGYNPREEAKKGVQTPVQNRKPGGYLQPTRSTPEKPGQRTTDGRHFGAGAFDQKAADRRNASLANQKAPGVDYRDVTSKLDKSTESIRQGQRGKHQSSSVTSFKTGNSGQNSVGTTVKKPSKPNPNFRNIKSTLNTQPTNTTQRNTPPGQKAG